MQIGIVSKLWRYPVKSMLGEGCERVELDARGVKGDRVFAIREMRKVDRLFPFHARYAEQGVEIVFPDGRRVAASDPAAEDMLRRALGVPVTFIREDGVAQVDSSPVHLVTTASLRWLAADERRFRPNIVVEAPGDGPVEQGWLGRTLRIGDDVRLRVTESTERCVMTTFAQADLPADPRVLTRIGREAQLRFGVYAEVLSLGTIACGDQVNLEKNGVRP